jgi:deoxyribodipyrimidine photo-lyase
MHRVVLWLRNDLRLQDNAVIDWACSQHNKEVIPVFCFDPRFYQREVKTYGTRKCGLIRTKFSIESVANLRASLEAIGSNLLVTCAKPEDFLDSIVTADTETTLVYQ